jgi:hypothetical protein
MRTLLHGLVVGMVLLSGPTLARAQLVFDPPSIDLGEAKAGQVFAKEVKVTNPTGSAITVADIKSSCGCVRPVMEPATLAPGASGVLKLEVNTVTSNPGPTTYGLRLRFQDQGQLREQQYVLTAHVIQEIVVNPASITCIGERPRPQTISLLDKRPTPFKPVKLERTSPFLEVEWVQPPQMDPQPQYALKVTVREDLPAGKHDHEVIVYTSDPAYPALRIPISITKRAKARFVASPILLSLTPGFTASRQVTVRDQQGQSLVIERVEASPGLVVTQAAQATSSITLNVSLDANVKDHSDGEVRVFVKGQSEPVKVLVNVE